MLMVRAEPIGSAMSEYVAYCCSLPARACDFSLQVLHRRGRDACLRMCAVTGPKRVDETGDGTTVEYDERTSETGRARQRPPLLLRMDRPH